jgi:hypothetical protein
MHKHGFIKIILICVLLSACVPATNPNTIPTLMVIPSDTPISVVQQVATPTPIPPTATSGPTPTPTTAPTADPNAVTLDNSTAFLTSRQIQFVARYTPMSSMVSEAVAVFTFPTTGETFEQRVPAGGQKIGQQAKVQTQMSIDRLPMHEPEVEYMWRLTVESGGVLTSEPQRFKITEAVTSEARNDLPIIPATLTFESQFPIAALFKVEVTPEVPILYARIFYTQNGGIVQHDYDVRVPRVEAGQPLQLQFMWNYSLGLQIPWQQWQWWWVFTDANGKVWRTEHAFNDFEDNTYHRWQRRETKHAILYTYDRSAADINYLAAATDESIEALEKQFGYKLLYRPRVVMYNNTRDFGDWAPPQMTESFVGLASGEWGGAVVAYELSLQYTAYGIIQHELAHLFQFQSIRRNVPQWWMEGSAFYLQYLPDNILLRVRGVVQAYGPPSIAYRIPDVSPDGQVYAWQYYVGATFIMYLKETYGDDAFAKMHTALARDIDFTDALEMVTGKTLTQLSADWAVWIMG